jgi:small-conductance mechanosensitive channel
MRPALPRSAGTRRLRDQRPRLGIGLIMALAVAIVAGVFGYYVVWRFLYD